MKKFIKSDKYKGTIEKFEETKIGNRDAIKYWNEEVHGFIYFINIDDLTEATSCMRMIITSSQGDMESISNAMNEKKKKIVINSFNSESVNNK